MEKTTYFDVQKLQANSSLLKEVERDLAKRKIVYAQLSLEEKTGDY